MTDRRKKKITCLSKLIDLNMLVDRSENKITALHLNKYDFAAAYLVTRYCCFFYAVANMNNSFGRKRILSSAWLEIYLFFLWTKKDMFLKPWHLQEGHFLSLPTIETLFLCCPLHQLRYSISISEWILNGKKTQKGMIYVYHASIPVVVIWYHMKCENSS